MTFKLAGTILAWGSRRKLLMSCQLTVLSVKSQRLTTASQQDLIAVQTTNREKMKTVLRSMAVLTFVCTFAVLGGCAFGKKMTYSNTVADVQASGTSTVAVAVHDERPYVVSANKEPSFVGLSRGGFGNPFNVSTQSGKPLADEMSASLTRSLSDRGFKASSVLVGASDSKRAVLDRLAASKSERQVLIALKEWKSDTFVHTSLIYDVTIRILSASGEELASTTAHGDETVGDVQAAFRSKIEDWFSDPKIVAALK